MRKTLSLLIFCVFIAVFAYAAVDTKDGTAITASSNMDGFTSNLDDVDGQVISAGTETPTASYALNAAGGSGSAQLYDSIAAAWKGGGADTVTFGADYLISNSTSDLAYIPASDFSYSDILTIYFEYQVDANSGNYSQLYFSAGGDTITFRHYYASNIGRFSFRCNYSDVSITWDNTGYALSTWHTVYIVINITGQNIDVYIDGSEVSGGTETGFTSIAAQSPSGNVYTGYLAAGTDNLWIRNLKIYNEAVTP